MTSHISSLIRAARPSIAAALASATCHVASVAAAASGTTYTLDHPITFTPGTRQALAAYSSVPQAAEVADSGSFVVATEDLDGDGEPETIAQAQSSAYCGSGGCFTVVLGRPGGTPTLLLSQNLNAPLGVTRERTNGWRALAALDPQGRIAIGERPGTPLYRKPLVYPMTVAAKRAPAGAPATKTPRVCEGVQYCAESTDLAMLVTNVRASRSGNSPERFVTVIASFRNKSTRPLVLGFDKRSAVVVDDAGNRYWMNVARGMPDVSAGQQVDTSFVVQPGEAGEARFEFLWQGSGIAGTVYDFDLAVRELVLLPSNQVRFGRDYALSVNGLRHGSAAASATGSPPRMPSGTGASPAAANGAGAPGAGASPAPGATAGDACAGSGACFAGGAFVAEVARVIVSQPSNGPVNAERVVRFQVRFRNVSDRPLILAHDPFSTVVIDDAGNRYGYWNYRVNVAGIGLVEGNNVDPSFALRPGEARAATFEVRFVYDSRRARPSDQYSFDLAVQEVEPLPGNQIRLTREHAIGFHDLTARTQAGGAAPGQGAADVVEGLRQLFRKKP